MLITGLPTDDWFGLILRRALFGGIGLDDWLFGLRCFLSFDCVAGLYWFKWMGLAFVGVLMCLCVCLVCFCILLVCVTVVNLWVG